jgi:hypothetical protein
MYIVHDFQSYNANFPKRMKIFRMAGLVNWKPDYSKAQFIYKSSSVSHVAGKVGSRYGIDVS